MFPSSKQNPITILFTGTMFISASKDTSAKLFDLDSLDCLKTYQTERPVNSASISPTQDHVNAAFFKKNIRKLPT